MEHVARPGTADARRGLALALAGALLLPITIVLVGISPQGARAWVFELGCAAAAAVSLWGGLSARRGLMTGTDRTAVAFGAAVLGCTIGITAGLVVIWGLIGLLT